MEKVIGIHAVEASIANRPERIRELLVLQGRDDKRINKILDEAKRQGIACQMHDKAFFARHYSELNTQGIVAIVTPIEQMEEHEIVPFLQGLSHAPLVLLLDGVTDPHNLGACLRSADAAGVDIVIVPQDKAAGLTPTVSKVASGAAESVPFVQVTNLARCMDALKEMGIWMYGLADEATDSFYQTDFSSGGVEIVLGAEDTGLRRLTREKCDGLMSIPMNGTVSSLNVSVATGICLYEVLRQRKSKKK